MHRREAGPAGWHRQVGERLILQLHVQPGASRTEVAGLHGRCLKIRLAARAIDGEANNCLVEFLARTLGAPKRAISIESGETSRTKRVSILSPVRGPQALWQE